MSQDFLEITSVSFKVKLYEERCESKFTLVSTTLKSISVVPSRFRVEEETYLDVKESF